MRDGCNYRLLPSRHDPINAFLAEVAGKLALLEWVAIIASEIAMFSPSTELAHRVWWMTLSLVSVSLLMVGLRGLSSGHAKRIGSIILIATNGLFVVVLLIAFVNGVREGNIEF